jgi:hypothetical protein
MAEPSEEVPSRLVSGIVLPEDPNVEELARDWTLSEVLVAAGDGAIMAGPVGTTPPMLDGGEWTHLFTGGTTQAARAGRDSFCQIG